DTNKWSNGLPGPSKVAVIDAAGSYTVSLDTLISAAGLVGNQTNAVIRAATDPALNVPGELRAGEFEVLTSFTVTLNRPLANRGILRWVSGCNRVDLQGNGRVENLGVWELFQDAACNNGSESIVRVPVNVLSGGKLLLSTNAQANFTAGSSLSVGGQLEI